MWRLRSHHPRNCVLLPVTLCSFPTVRKRNVSWVRSLLAGTQSPDAEADVHPDHHCHLTLPVAGVRVPHKPGDHLPCLGVWRTVHRWKQNNFTSNKYSAWETGRNVSGQNALPCCLALLSVVLFCEMFWLSNFYKWTDFKVLVGIN